jgi:membrane protease YdiL (CAAX protease family)
MNGTTGLRASRPRPEWLLLFAAVLLTAFYYVARVDVIGVTASTRGWSQMTARPLPSAVYFPLSAVLLGVLPLLAARRCLGARPAALGLGFGRWRWGIALVAVGIPIALLAGKIAAGSPAMRGVYPLDPTVRPVAGSFVPFALLESLYYFSWEVLFRGVLLFGLAPAFGPAAANVIQTALSVTAHFSRPMDETFAALPFGLLCGALGLRLRSIWYLAFVHWMVGTATEWFILTS